MHQLARAILSKINVDRVLDSTIDASRGVMIGNLKRLGKDDAQAADLIDQFMLPEFHARTPELRALFENILVLDLNPDEMQATLSGENNAARQSARAKAPQIQADFTNAGRSWGEAVANDAIRKNAEELRRRGVTL